MNGRGRRVEPFVTRMHSLLQNLIHRSAESADSKLQVVDAAHAGHVAPKALKASTSRQVRLPGP
jgi:hypothetical protein